MGVVKQNIREFKIRTITRLSLWNVEHRNPILIYQMGKVGSSTLSATLTSMHLSSPVLQIHTLSESNLKQAISRHRQSARPSLDGHLIQSRILMRKLSNGLFPVRVITLTREPIERAISFVFEDIQKQAPRAIGTSGGIDRNQILSRLDQILATSNGISDPSVWFDSELKDIFGCDVFKSPFDRTQGYSILRSGSVPVLVLRMEDLDWALTPAISDFLSLDPEKVRITSSNVGSAKWYGEDLRWVKQNYRAPEEVLKRIRESKYYLHFYS